MILLEIKIDMEALDCEEIGSNVVFRQKPIE